MEFECVYDVEMFDVIWIREIFIRSLEKEIENLIYILINVFCIFRKYIIDLIVRFVV